MASLDPPPFVVFFIADYLYTAGQKSVMNPNILLQEIVQYEDSVCYGKHLDSVHVFQLWTIRLQYAV